MKTMMTWGMFPFALESLPYANFTKRTNYKYASNSRVGARNARQFLGPGDDDITLTGKLLPFVTGGRNMLEIIRLQASSGIAFPLIERNGRIHGFYHLENVEDVSRQFEHNGAPHIVDFTLEFKRDEEDMLGTLGIITSQIVSLI